MNSILQRLIDCHDQIPHAELAEFALGVSKLPTYKGYPIHVRADCPENSVYLMTEGARIEDFGIHMHPKTHSEMLKREIL